MNTKYNEENIRLAAYYNWQNAGCPSGKDEYFWNQAISQLYGSCKNSTCGCKKSTTTKSSTTKSSSTKSMSAKTTASTKSGTNANKKSSTK